MKSDRRPLPPPPGSRLSGPTDDSSAMFSLKTLAAKVESTATATQAATTVDDSGLIDLRKLMASAEATANLPPVLAPEAAYPFGPPEETTLLPQVFETQAVVVETNTVHNRKKWIAIGAAMVVSTLITVGVMQVSRREPSQLATSPTQAASPVPAAQAEPSKFVETVPSPVVEEKTPPASVNTVATSAAAPVRAQRAVPVAPRRDRSTSTAPTPTNKAEVKKPPPSAPCDLMCEIQRAAQRKKQK